MYRKTIALHITGVEAVGANTCLSEKNDTKRENGTCLAALWPCFPSSSKNDLIFNIADIKDSLRSI